MGTSKPILGSVEPSEDMGCVATVSAILTPYEGFVDSVLGESASKFAQELRDLPLRSVLLANIEGGSVGHVRCIRQTAQRGNRFPHSGFGQAVT